jgi:D-3-phosphoglycerate dehydrogenase
MGLFGAKVIVFDPYKNIENEEYEKAESLDELVSKSDIISLHVHVSEETTNMLDRDLFSKMKSDILLVNTARGDVLNEKDLVDFLSQNPKAKVATDVLCDEIRGRTSSPLLLHSKVSNQILITPHIGGMTREAQEIAFNHAATRLKIFFD